MSDLAAIAAAVATRYAPANLVPPAGLTNVRSSTADLPSRLVLGRSPRPVVLVFPDAGDLAPGGGGRAGHHRMIVRFYLAPHRDLARETNACLRWLGVLLDVHGTAATLGGLVTIVRTKTYRIGLMRYAGVDYTGIELGLELETREAWVPTP